MRYFIFLLLLVGVTAESWVPYEATLILFDEFSIQHYHRFNLTSPILNSHRDLTLRCEGDCDYIPAVFQCTGNLGYQGCRIETRPGYRLTTFRFENNGSSIDPPGTSQMLLVYQIIKDSRITSHNCDPDYLNWVEDTFLAILNSEVLVMFIGMIAVVSGFAQRPIFVGIIFGYALICNLVALVGIRHMAYSCVIHRN